jgi:general L-amino acid transport system permease protein
VLGTLPGPRQSLSFFGEIFLNNRGVIVPAPVFGDGSRYVLAAFLLGVVVTVVLARWARRRQEETGRQFPLFWASVALLIGLPLLVFFATGFPIGLERPQLRGFNFVGGLRLIPEFVALLAALSIYTAAFIAEVVRAGILAVSAGRRKRRWRSGCGGTMLRLIMVPQALRVIVPPLTNQYLNLTRTLARRRHRLSRTVHGLCRTTLNQTGQIEIIAITMAVYPSISLITSAAMNWYNARIRLSRR